jgi:hypothetical protein
VYQLGKGLTLLKGERRELSKAKEYDYPRLAGRMKEAEQAQERGREQGREEAEGTRQEKREERAKVEETGENGKIGREQEDRAGARTRGGGTSKKAKGHGWKMASVQHRCYDVLLSVTSSVTTCDNELFPRSPSYCLHLDPKASFPLFAPVSPTPQLSHFAPLRLVSF